MVAVHPSYDCLKAVGIDNKGERLEFKVNDIGNLYCSGYHLVSLEIPKGVKYLYCMNNLLTELVIPSGVKEVACYRNKLTELNIPIGLKTLSCDMSVLGLDKVNWDCDIRLY